MKSLMASPPVIPSILRKGQLLATAVILLASIPYLSAAADEIVTLRIRGDGWTIQHLDSQQDTWHSATIRLILDGLTYITKLDAVRVRGPAARPSVSERRGGLANEEPWRPNLQPERRREHRSLQCG